MKAVLLAAGKGTRMKELTQALPKPMLRVQGRPILEHILAGLRAAGLRECCIVTGWRGDTIREHFADGARLGLRLCYVEQTVQDGTGKAPELARNSSERNRFCFLTATSWSSPRPTGKCSDAGPRGRSAACSP